MVRAMQSESGSQVRRGPLTLQAVLEYRAPRFPTHLEWSLHPALLQAVPKRWRAHPLVLGVLATAWAALGCHRSPPSDSVDEQSSPPLPVKPSPLAKVAPIFKHGEGRIQTGGENGVNFSFLTEEEAIRVVTDEASKAGLFFGRHLQTIPSMDLPSCSLSGPFATRAPSKRAHRGALVLDGSDLNRNVMFEYLSHEDYNAWGGSEGNSTVQDYDFLGAAQVLRDGIEQSGYRNDNAYGVFYDPLVKEQPMLPVPAGKFNRSTRVPTSFVWDLLQAHDTATKKEPFRGSGSRVQLTADPRMATVDGSPLRLSAPAVLRQGNAWVPLDSVLDMLQIKAAYDTSTNLLTVPVGDRRFQSKPYAVDFGGAIGTASAAFPEYDSKLRESGTVEAARERLREQVRDFIVWLKAQGVI